MIRRFAPIQSLETLVRRARDARSAARWIEATELYREATRDAVRFGRPFVVVECLNALGAIAFEVGDLERADRRFGLALRLARSSGHAQGEAAALVSLGAISNMRGDYGEAIGHYRRGRWAYRRARSAAGEARALNNLGMAFAEVGKWDAAARCYQQARKLAADLGDEGLMGLVSINATEVWLALGQPERARRSAIEASGHFRRAGDHAGRAEVARFLGQVERRAGRTGRAVALFRMAIEGDRRLEAPLGRT